MPNFAQTLSPAHSDRCSSVGVKSQADNPPNVLEQGLQTEALGCTIANAMEFGLTTAQRDSGLGLAPMLDEALAKHGNSAGG